ncbi:MAG: rod shape-determining protein RodA [Bacillota bacterium]
MKLFNRTQFKNFDWILFALIMTLCVVGIISIMNATANPYPDDESAGLLARIDWHTVLLQSAWILVGTLFLFVMQMMDYTVIGEHAKLLYWISVGLLVAVLVTGYASRGTQGWFQIIGDRTIQPSELGKIILIIMLSKMVSKKMDTGGITGFRDIIDVMILFAIPFGLIMLQPDWGTAFVYVCIFFGILFAAEVNWKIILSIIGTGLAMLPVVFFVFMQSWQRERILNFFNATRDTSGSGLNVYNSKIAIGSGGLFGKGLFNEANLSSLNYVPEKHTDFIFSATTEALGFVGGMVILALYALLIFRALSIASQSRDKLGYLMVIGVVAMEVFHIFENIGMTMGIMPVTGIPLPFLSYGGSSMLTNMIAFGLVLNVGLKRQPIPALH